MTQNFASIDVSDGNGVIDWVEVKAAGIEYAYIRATDPQRANGRDRMFQRNRDEAKAVGIKIGLYHVVRPEFDPVHQIDLFRNAVGSPSDLDLPFALHFEAIENDSDWGALSLDVRQKLAAQLVAGAEVFTGRKAVVHTAPTFWSSVMGSAHLVGGIDFSLCPLWIADCVVTRPIVPAGPVVPYPWSHWWLWQHDENGSVPGIGQCTVGLGWISVCRNGTGM